MSDILRNRFLQKKALERSGIPTAAFRLARNHRELVAAHRALGFPGLLSLQFAGRENRGPWIVRDYDDVPPVLRETNGSPLLWETAVQVDAAFTLRAQVPDDGQFCESPSPGSERMTAAELQLARELTRRIAEALQVRGPFAVDFVRSGDRLIVDRVREAEAP